MIKSQWRRDQTSLTREVKEVEICQSCETLREQLSLERQTNSKLMDRLLEKPEKPVDTPPVMNTRPLLNRHTPWRVRQQLLETEDRERANKLKDAPRPATDVNELEKELNIASAERAAEATNKNA
jgi:hypothetical protein